MRLFFSLIQWIGLLTLLFLVSCRFDTEDEDKLTPIENKDATSKKTTPQNDSLFWFDCSDIQSNATEQIPTLTKSHPQPKSTKPTKEKPLYQHPIYDIPALATDSIALFTITETSETSLVLKNTLATYHAHSVQPLLHRQPYLVYGFDNDFWDMTDYYYTNGIYIALHHTVFAFSPLAKLLIKHKNKGQEIHGLVLVQNMYTGLKPKIDSIIPGDRPWSSYSLLGQFLYAYDTQNKRRHFSQISIGLLGPKSGGAFLQTLAHAVIPTNSPPQGWHHQIATDVILDYQYELTTILYEQSRFESYAIGAIRAGSLRNHLRWGFGARYGKFVPFYIGKQDYTKAWRHHKQAFKASLHANIQTQWIGFDAGLQGGLFNRTSEYSLPASAISRFVVCGQLGFRLSYGPWELSVTQFWKSKEFTEGKDHKYIQLRIGMGL